jgi:hypothetical protein
MSDPTTERVRFLREASRVVRCHTHGAPDPAYNVGLHTHGIMDLLLVLHPDPPLELIKAVQWHDAPERYTGDTPAITKWHSTDIANALSRLEVRIHEHFGTQTVLDRSEVNWLVCLDKLELLFWANEQRALGDYRFDHMATVLVAWFASRKNVPVQIARLLEIYAAGARLRDDMEFLR